MTGQKANNLCDGVVSVMVQMAHYKKRRKKAKYDIYKPYVKHK